MKTYPYPAGKIAVKWVSTDWLNDHISDENLMILDVQPNVHDYIMGHLPGAIYLNEGLLRSAHNGLQAVFVPPEVLQPIPLLGGTANAQWASETVWSRS